MTESTEKEPTMEEILASIRRIISEDATDEEESVEAAEFGGADESSAEFEEPVADDPEEISSDDEPLDAASVDELFGEPVPVTDMQTEDVPEVEFDTEPDVALEPEEEPGPEPEPEPEPELEPELEEDVGFTDVEDDVLELTELAEEEPGNDEALVPGDDEALVSHPTEEKAGASFAELSAMLVGGYEGSSNTLEGLVREMLKPMLRVWLDENLPGIVEDMVEREVARIAARRGRK